MSEPKPPIPVYFTSLEIENVRCFGARQTLDLTGKGGRPAQWTLILGENGVGKTTLLQGLAWMHLVPANFDPALFDEENEVLESLLRDGSNLELELGARLSLGLGLSSTGQYATDSADPSKLVGVGGRIVFDANRLLSEPQPRNEMVSDDEFPEPLVIAYGANRQRGVQNLDSGDLDDPIASRRLSGRTELYDVEEILSSLDYAATKDPDSSERRHLERLRDVLARIIPENLEANDIQILPPDVLDHGGPSGVLVRTFSGLVPLSALSLGYQTTLAWITDFAWRLLKRYPESRNPLAEPAVVLVDELDLHLHPLWQLRIIDDLTAFFPGTQFIATAHSPLIVQVAEAANLVLLRRREADVEIVNDPEVISSWRVDQILTSELFGVKSARSKGTENLFKRMDELVDNPTRSAAEETELTDLRLKISELPTARNHDTEKAMMDFIRRAESLIEKHKVAEQ